MPDIFVGAEPVKVIAGILKSEMALDDDQIVLSYQKIKINKAPDLFVVLAYIGGKAIGNNNYFDDSTNEEVQQVAMHHTVQIDLMSYDDSGRTRKEEILMALRSVYGQQQMEGNGMQIARIPGEFVNTASLEETKILNRFTLNVTIKSIYEKRKTVEYFDTFQNAEVIYGS